VAYIKIGGHGGRRAGSGRKRSRPLSERLSQILQWRIGALCAEEMRRKLENLACRGHDKRLRAKGIRPVTKLISRLRPSVRMGVIEAARVDEFNGDLLDEDDGISWEEQTRMDAAIQAVRHNRKRFKQLDKRALATAKARRVGRTFGARCQSVRVRLSANGQKEIFARVKIVVGKEWRIRLPLRDIRECWAAFYELESRLIRDARLRDGQS
jgi:hypothetical protein